MTVIAPAAESVDLDKKIENILHDKLGHFLDDISFRIEQAYEIAERSGGRGKGTVFAEDLNLMNRVFLTGYTLTNNSPTAGSIAWTDLHVVYNGVDTTITNGNTALKYITFTPTTTPNVLKFSATKPSLADGDVLLFVNEGGVARNMLSDTNASLPRLVASNAVDTDAIANDAVTRDQIKNSEIVAGKLGVGAINATNLINGKIITGTVIANEAVGSDQIGPNAVVSTKIADNAISKTSQMASKVIQSANLNDNAVTATQIANNAVTALKVADGAIVRPAQVSGKVIDSTNLVNGAVTNLALDNGAVNAAKLNIMRHIMY